MRQTDAQIAVCAALAATAPSVTVMRGQSDAVRQGTPYISVIQITTTPIGYPGTTTEGDTTTAGDNQEVRYQINAVGEAAVSGLEDFHALLQLPDSVPATSLRADGVGVLDRGVFQNMGAFYKTGIEPRAMLEIRVNFVWSAATTVSTEPAVAVTMTTTNDDEQSRTFTLDVG